jgi:hypothetical protein
VNCMMHIPTCQATPRFNLQRMEGTCVAGTHAAARRALPDGSVPHTSKDQTAHKHKVKPANASTVKRLEKLVVAQEERFNAKLETPGDGGITFKAAGIDSLVQLSSRASPSHLGSARTSRDTAPL